ncbi:MAG: tetratricopeptide repeat protein [Blastocatellia bacterium]
MVANNKLNSVLKRKKGFFSKIIPSTKIALIQILGIGLFSNVSLAQQPIANNLNIETSNYLVNVVSLINNKESQFSLLTSLTIDTQRPGTTGQSGTTTPLSRPGTGTTLSRPGTGNALSRPGIGGTVGLSKGVSLSRPGTSNVLSRPGIERSQALGVQQVGEATAQATRRIITGTTGPETILKTGDTIVEKDPDKAINIYKNLIEKNPNFGPAYAALGYAYIQKEDFDQAIDNLRTAIEKDSKDSDARLNLGVALYRSGEIENAIKEYEQLKTDKSDNPDVYYNLGVAYAHQGKFKDALDEINLAITKRKNKKYPEAYNNLGLIYEVMGQFDKSIESFQAAIEQQGGIYPIANYNLGRIYVNKGNSKENKFAAIKQYELATKQNTKFAEAYLEQGNAWLFLNNNGVEGSLGKAIEKYQKALEIRDNFYPLAHENMAIVYSKLGQKDKALQHYYLAFEQYDGRCPEALQNLVNTIIDEQFFSITNELDKVNNAGSLKNKVVQEKIITKDGEEIEAIFFRTMKNLLSYADVDEELKDNAFIRYCAGRSYAFVGDWQLAANELAAALTLAKKEAKQPDKNKEKADNEINVKEDAERALLTIASNNLVAILP